MLSEVSARIADLTGSRYEDYAVSQFISVKSEGAKGDGSTDDTAALQAVFSKVRHQRSAPVRIAISLLTSV